MSRRITQAIAGPQGFARPPVTGAVLGVYVQAPLGSTLVGAQLGSTIADGAAQATYVIATLGVASHRRGGWQTYPFVGVGGGVLRPRDGPDHVRPVFAAGLGADFFPGPSAVTIGSRVGYLTRSSGESVAYVTVSLGLGLRRSGLPTFATR